MSDMIFTFWEGEIPKYLKLCMNTWHFDYIVLNYQNIEKYTDSLPNKLKQLSLPKIADYIRVHVLKNNGGYWLDTDTIILSDTLPQQNIFGFTELRSNTIGFLHTEPNSEMYKEWANYQENVITNLSDNLIVDNTPWNIMGNKFTDEYVKNHEEIVIGEVRKCWPETYIIKDNIERNLKYRKFYFESDYHLKDINFDTNILMLHNSWTPKWYKDLNEENILKTKCTLSNIINELL